MAKGKHSSRRRKSHPICGLTLQQVDASIDDLIRAIKSKVNKGHPIRGPHYRKQLDLWSGRRHDYHNPGKEVT